MPTPTQKELARRLGLSRSTIAAALNPKSPVKLREETRDLIFAEAKKMGYRPHRYAQIMRQGRSGLIGIFHFGGLYQVAAERALHASQAIHAAGYQVLSNEGSWNQEGVKASCEAMIDARVEGVIVAGLHNPSDGAELGILRRAGIPIVSLSGNSISQTPQVRANAEEAFYQVTKHIIRLGRRRILLLHPNLKGLAKESRDWSGAERLAGFQRAAGEAGISEVERFTKGRRAEVSAPQAESSPGSFDQFAPAYEALKAWLTGNPAPDAVVCGNDHWAIGAMAALHEAGLKVPSDVAVTGFDNIAVGSYLQVPLTTLAQPAKAIAEKSVELLLKKIQGRRVSLQPVRFSCELIIRASCGAKRPAG